MSAPKHAIVLVGFEPDWEALYIEGEKVAEGHKIPQALLVTATAEFVSREGHPDVKLETTHVEGDEADEHEEHTIPESLYELEASAPLAYGRISA